MRRPAGTRRPGRPAELLALGLVLAAVCSSAGAEKGGAARDVAVKPADRGQVVRVVDGDTIVVRLPDGAEKKVRLIGIDSPEMDDERETVLFFAHMAKRFAFYYLFETTVGLAYDWERTDDYGRTLAYVVLADGTLFNELIVKQGFAHAFTKYPYSDEMKERFRRAERYARRYNKGLWREKPWPVVDARGARAFLGSVATVRFLCREVVEKGRYVYLESGVDFEVFSQDPLPLPLADLRALAGRRVSVTGLVEDFRGRTQIVLTLPSQLASGSDAEAPAVVERAVPSCVNHGQ